MYNAGCSNQSCLSSGQVERSCLFSQSHEDERQYSAPCSAPMPQPSNRDALLCPRTRARRARSVRTHRRPQTHKRQILNHSAHKLVGTQANAICIQRLGYPLPLLSQHCANSRNPVLNVQECIPKILYAAESVSCSWMEETRILFDD